tara:strand:- start:774 stop:1736 length:963 start_codon:yes stop_codon:yes gene_type:complete
MLPIYCISLQRKRKERFLNLKSNFFEPMKLNVIEWKAIDGCDYNNNINLAKKYNLKLTNLGKELDKSVLATAISHRNVWKNIIRRNLSGAIIFEDDIKIYDDFKDKVNIIWNDIKDNQNINFLLLSYSDNILIDPRKSNYSNLISKIQNFNGLFCYLVKKEGAKQLLKLTDKLSYQIDIHLSKKNNYYFCTTNKIAYHDEDSITTIHNHRFKLLEVYFKLNILNYKILKIFHFYVFTFFSLFLSILGFILGFLNYNFYFVSITNILIFILELKLIGGRFDELAIRIPGVINIGSYDSDEIANKIVDHLFFSIIFTIVFFY